LQILWIETGNVRLHMQLGWMTVGLSVVMVPLGLAAALVDQARQVGHSVFMVSGVIFRWNAAAHKRLMLLSAVAISDAGFARIRLMGIKIELLGAIRVEALRAPRRCQVLPRAASRKRRILDAA
jgi:hypothetical protein